MDEKTPPPENAPEIIHTLWRKQIHKLNNCLAAIIGHSSLLSYDIPEDESTKGFIKNIRAATMEALDVCDILGELEICVRPSFESLSLEDANKTLALLSQESMRLPPFEVAPPPLSEFSTHEGIEHLLLVEDDAQFRPLLIQCLTELGYTVDVAVDGQEAIEKFTALQDDLDLVCIDFHLPYANGFEVAKAIRKLRPRIRLMLLSGAPVDPEEPAIKELVFSRIMSKPLDITEFARTVRQVLNEPAPAKKS